MNGRRSLFRKAFGKSGSIYPQDIGRFLLQIMVLRQFDMAMPLKRQEQRFPYLAYLLDIYEPPVIKNWFAARGQMTNERVYALNMLVQWVWRSAVRDGQIIHLYLPSQRMRNILYEWLEIPGEERPRIKNKVWEKTAFQASSLKDKRVKHKEN